MGESQIMGSPIGHLRSLEFILCKELLKVLNLGTGIINFFFGMPNFNCLFNSQGLYCMKNSLEECETKAGKNHLRNHNNRAEERKSSVRHCLKPLQ